jgi:putative addiction module component (TIGR02574 family)
MAVSTSPELQEAREVVDRAMKLPPAVREGIALQIIQSLEPTPTDADNDLRAEIARRLEAIKDGTMKMYSLEETMTYLQSVVDEDRPA